MRGVVWLAHSASLPVAIAAGTGGNLALAFLMRLLDWASLRGPVRHVIGGSQRPNDRFSRL